MINQNSNPDWEEFKIKRQKHFDNALHERMFMDTVYTTKQIEYIYNLLDDFNLDYRTLRKMLFTSTIAKKISHIQVERMHFWYKGEPLLKRFEICNFCHEYRYKDTHEKECIQR